LLLRCCLHCACSCDSRCRSLQRAARTTPS
jgi:hypothetical protein